MSAQEHARYEQDAGAYVLGALDQVEQRDFERHLATCRTCLEEVERLRPAADALPRAVTPLAAPPTLKRSLMEVVEREADERGAERPRVSLRERIAGLIPSAARPTPALGWAAAAVALALAVTTGFGLARMTGGEDAETMRASVDAKRMPTASARLVMPDHGEDGAILRARGLPRPGRGRTYQAWIEADGEVMPGPLFSPGRDGSAAAAIPQDMHDVDAVMVTRESARGADAPSEKPVVVVKL